MHTMMNIARRAIGKTQRMAAERFNKTSLYVPDSFRRISFCFDDFPASAADYGAGMLEDYGVRGTFYTCFGLLGEPSPSGNLASMDNIISLAGNRHEIGCHTYDHINCSFTDAQTVAQSCDKNIKTAVAHGINLKHFAYPQGGMSMSTKKIMQRFYGTARSIIHGINKGQCDAHCIKSVPIYETAPHQRIYNLIDQVESDGGWLILYTHDISDMPSPYGVSKTFFRDIVAYCAAKQLPISTIEEAMRSIGAESRQ